MSRANTPVGRVQGLYQLSNFSKPLKSELRKCLKVEVDVMGSRSLIVHSVSVDVTKY